MGEAGGVLVTHIEDGNITEMNVEDGVTAEIEIMSKDGARKLTVYDGSSEAKPVAGVTVGPDGVLTWEADP